MPGRAVWNGRVHMWENKLGERRAWCTEPWCHPRGQAINCHMYVLVFGQISSLCGASTGWCWDHMFRDHRLHRAPHISASRRLSSGLRAYLSPSIWYRSLRRALFAGFSPPLPATSWSGPHPDLGLTKPSRRRIFGFLCCIARKHGCCAPRKDEELLR